MKTPIIKLNSIRRTHYVGGEEIHALDGIDLEIEKGEFLAIVGRSGSGKTSLLNILGFLDSPTSGDLYYFGKKIGNLNFDEQALCRNHDIGFIFQSFHLLERLNAIENTEVPLIYRGVPPKERRVRSQEALNIVGLPERKFHFPNQLSGGEQQRVAMARALVCSPQLILADEPTGSLDSITSNQVMMELRKLNNKGITVILVTHDTEVAAQADRVISMRDGKIISDRNLPAPKKNTKKTSSPNVVKVQDRKLAGLGFLSGLKIAVNMLFSTNLLRSTLTGLGIVIGVASVILMISIGRGAQFQVTQQINSLGANLLLVQSKPSDSVGGSGKVIPLTEIDAEMIAQNVRGVDAAAPAVSGSFFAISGNRNQRTTIGGVTPEYFIAREWGVVSGRIFTPDELRTAGKVGLIGATLSQKLFDKNDPLGEVIRVAGIPIRLIGVLEKKGQSPNGIDQDDVILVPITTAKLRLLGNIYRGNRRAVRYILVKVKSDAFMEFVPSEIQEILREKNPQKSANFTVQNLGSIFQAKEETSRSFAILLASVASVSLLVGGISVMTTMLVSVTERTREIGLRLALGARPRDIRSQFLIESLTLSLLGGAIGILIGFFASIGIGVIAKWPVIIEPASIGIALISSALVGIAFGYFPARRASKLNPIEALRVE